MKLVPRSSRGRLLLAAGATLAIVVPIGWQWQASLLPETYDIATMGYVDYGGGPREGHAHGHGNHEGTPVAELVGDVSREPDVVERLTVRRDGDRFTVNGTSPGPTIRAVQGQLVEVTLVNENVPEGVTLHWHGVDVPNAADGVAGVTQDAVGEGQSHVYRFEASRSGTYWYHSHQVSHEQVRKGLLGALVIDPMDPASLTETVLDELAVLHQYGAKATLNGREGSTSLAAEPRQQVRLRVVNTDNALTPVWVTGAPYTVLAVDGTDLHEPTPVTDRAVRVTAGARVDLGFTVPPDGMRVDFGGTTTLLVGDDPTEGETPAQPKEFVDFGSYGNPTDPGLDTGRPDRVFDYEIGRRLGFIDGKPGRWWTINGRMFPDVPMFMVDEGDVVVFRIDNNSGESHPMHLHGHHALVLSHNGRKTSGSPWWVDSLEVETGGRYEVAFLADNPGLWMDHCHNLPHAAEGLTAHLMYSGVRSSFRIGDKAHNHPE